MECDPTRVCELLVGLPAIAASRLVMTDRAGRWVTEQVGLYGRTVNEVASELGCDASVLPDDAGSASEIDEPYARHDTVTVNRLFALKWGA